MAFGGRGDLELSKTESDLNEVPLLEIDANATTQKNILTIKKLKKKKFKGKIFTEIDDIGLKIDACNDAVRKPNVSSLLYLRQTKSKDVNLHLIAAKLVYDD